MNSPLPATLGEGVSRVRRHKLNSIKSANQGSADLPTDARSQVEPSSQKQDKPADEESPKRANNRMMARLLQDYKQENLKLKDLNEKLLARIDGLENEMK
mmetsp:Transcript_3626/g.4441  ORF Transcript_3626/g.4441 Transcript_3626/m.4441 type:complete len:100 (+) Transcript_3626:425-724(+)